MTRDDESSQVMREKDWESEERRLGVHVPYCIRFLRELLRQDAERDD